jgi:hypothetical protein
MKFYTIGILLYLASSSAWSSADTADQWDTIKNLTPAQHQSDLALLQCLATTFKNNPELTADINNSRSTILAISNFSDESTVLSSFQAEIDHVLSTPLSIGEKDALPLKSLTCLKYYHDKSQE